MSLVVWLTLNVYFVTLTLQMFQPGAPIHKFQFLLFLVSLIASQLKSLFQFFSGDQRFPLLVFLEFILGEVILLFWFFFSNSWDFIACQNSWDDSWVSWQKKKLGNDWWQMLVIFALLGSCRQFHNYLIDLRD